MKKSDDTNQEIRDDESGCEIQNNWKVTLSSYIEEDN
jgi:hypothetical protein